MRAALTWIGTTVLVLLLGAMVLYAAGCGPRASGILRGAQTVLDAVCESRPAWPVLRQAHDELSDGNLLEAHRLLEGYLVDAKQDPEVSALLALLKTQLHDEAPATK